MTFKMKIENAESGRKSFLVGQYDLYAERSCEEARTYFGLSHREIELVMWVASGRTKREIADRMGVTPSTTDTFRRRAYTKLGVACGSAASALISAYLAGAVVERRTIDGAA
jgi:DNA-binding NarL/FixJ family response regulator